ncbi:MAG TPA: PhoH family protein, partial [Candidatus Acidoferrales bacterium]|nr:PhoH family protein [Candidatus Acidoferrales bacterium]
MATETIERSLDLRGLTDRVRLFGEHDGNLSAIESGLAISVHIDGDRLLLAGSALGVERGEYALRQMLDAAIQGAHVTKDDVTLAISDAHAGSGGQSMPATLLRTSRGREVRPRTPGQRHFVDAIAHHTLTLGIGPAGTGKTYLA